MEPHSPKSPRFSDTPPGSPKSCMKGSRKVTYENKPTHVDVGVSAVGNPSPVPSPSSKRSPKSVQIRMAGDPSSSGRSTCFDLPVETSSASCQTSGATHSKAAPPPEIQFQFELTEHFDQSTPPPNCTSNGNYDFDDPQQTTPSSTSTSGADPEDDPRKDPQLIEIANKFVNDIIEKAKVEAANRQKAEEQSRGGTTAGTTSADRDSLLSDGIARGAGTWLRRAHGTVSKWITTICVRAQNIRADLK